MRILVCGGRKFDDYKLLESTLDRLWGPHYLDPPTIIQGGATGADSLAKMYAIDCDLVYEEYRADWYKHGKAAGPIRNQNMLDFGNPDVVVAFPGGAGTADMVKRAKKAKVKVVEVTC